MRFPPAIPLPDDVAVARSRRTARMVWVASLGIFLRLLVIAVELWGVWLLGYAVLLVDALASMADVVASVTILIAIKLADRPPDDEHPFGHGRYEPLAGLQLGVLICLGAVWLAGLQLTAAVRHPPQGIVYAWAWAIPLAAAVLLEGCYHLVHRTGRRENSSALVAEAYHYRVDAATSLLAALGLLIAAFVPAWATLLDHLFAMLLALIMAGLGLMAIWENLHQLLDRAPHPRCFRRVRAAALRVNGVRDVEKVRIQNAGPDAHVDIDVEVDPDTKVSAAHEITQQVRAQIQTDWPAVRDVVVHVEPYYPGDH